jgi:hypothetical protein
MKKYGQLIRTDRFFAVILAVFCAAFFCTSVWSSGASSSKKEIHAKQIEKLESLKRSLRVENLKVTNKTQHFYIVSIRKTPNGDILLSLRNDYDKKITSYELSMGSKVTMADYIYSEREDGILPGNIVDNYQAIDIDPELSAKGIAILAVMFEDGTSDGDPAHIREITQYRLGGKMQMEQALDTLEKLKSLPKSKMTAELSRIKTQLTTSEPENDALPRYFKFGMDDVRMILSREVERLSDASGNDTESQLNNVIEKYKQMKSKSPL